jgi:hypothetical protein
MRQKVEKIDLATFVSNEFHRVHVLGTDIVASEDIVPRNRSTVQALDLLFDLGVLSGVVHARSFLTGP